MTRMPFAFAASIRALQRAISFSTLVPAAPIPFMLVPVVTTSVLQSLPPSSSAVIVLLSSTGVTFACMEDILTIMAPGLWPQVVAIIGVSTFGRSAAKAEADVRQRARSNRNKPLRFIHKISFQNVEPTIF